MLKRMIFLTVLLITAMLVINQVVIPHVRRSRGHDELRMMRLQKGREVIAKAIAAYGGLEAWQSKTSVSFRLKDKWNGGARSVVADWVDMWPAHAVETVQHYLLPASFSSKVHEVSGRIEMDTEKGHHIWGYNDLRPWALLNGRLDPENMSRARFTIPAINYFLALPYKFLDDGAFPEFINEIKQGGQIYNRVRVSFGLNAGNYPPDEYVADFDQETGRLAHLEYTVREKLSRCITLRADFRSYQRVDGIWLPTHVDFGMAEPLSLALHQWQISEVRFNTGVGESFFSPDEARLSAASWRQ